MAEDVTMTLRVSAELRASFLRSCTANHVPAAQVLRAYMREYIEANAQAVLPLTSKPAKSRKAKPK